MNLDTHSKPYWILLPALVAIIFHLPVLFCDLVWDDEMLVKRNPVLLNHSSLETIFNHDYATEFGASPAGYYRPALTLINLAIYKISGASPLAYHFTSLLLFCFSTVLLTWTLWTLLGKKDRLLPLTAGSIFAAHPARTEVVSFFMSMPDLLMEIYALYIIMILVKTFNQNHSSTKQSVPIVPISVSLLLAFLAGITKESSFFIIPALGFTALLYSAAKKQIISGSIIVIIGLATGLALAFTLRIFAGIHQQYPSLAYFTALFNQGSGLALLAIASVAQNLLMPSDAVFMAENNAPSSLLATILLISLVITFLLMVRLLIRRGNLFSVLLFAWFGAGTLNVMLILTAGLPYSDRYLPVAPGIAGICLIFAGAFGIIRNWWPALNRFACNTRLISLLIAGIVCIYGTFTFASSAKCVSSVRFFSFMANENPSLAYPRIALSKIMFNVYGNMDLAEKYAREAIVLSSDSSESRSLGKLLARKYIYERKYKQAITSLDWTTEIITNDAEVLSLKSLAMASAGDTTNALLYIEKAIGLDPNNTQYNSLKQQIIAHSANSVSAGK